MTNAELYDQVPVGLLILDDQYRIVFANERFRETFDCAAADLNGRMFENLFSPRDRIGAVKYHQLLSSYQGGVLDTQVTLRVGDADVAARVRLRQHDDEWIALAESMEAEQRQINDLSLSKKRLDTIITYFGDGVLILNEQHAIQECNNKAFEYLDLRTARGVKVTAEAIVGGSLFDFVSDERFDGLQTALNLAETNSDAQFDDSFRIAGRYLHISMHPIYVPRSGFIGSCITIRDMTDLRETEKSLRRSEETFRTVVDQLPASVMLKDLEGRYLLTNRMFLEWFCDQDEEIIGKTVYDILPKEVSDEMTGIDRRVTETRQIDHRELTQKFSDGEVHTTTSSRFPIVGADGELIAVGAIESDITERKQIEIERADQFAFQQALVDAISFPIFYKGADTRFLGFNKAYEEAFGIKREDLIGLRVLDLEYLPEEDRTAFQNEDEETIRTEGTVMREMEIPFADESMRDTIYTVSGFRKSDGSPGGLIGSIFDITERKRAEQNLADAYDIISSSIDYASRIQRSILPDDDEIAALTDDYFIIWEPRDVVGGDIYWAGLWGDGFLIVLGDCTGHGVPGAFMTLICMGAMERALSEVETGDVGALLSRVHQLVQLTLGQHLDDGESDDGIEMGACYFVSDATEMAFAGARFELVISENEEIAIVKGTKAGAGYRGIPYEQTYEQFSISLKPGQNFYMTTDGLIDQVGGERRRAFGKRRFGALLATQSAEPFAAQKEAILQALKSHQGDENRRDDVSVIGFRIQ